MSKQAKTHKSVPTIYQGLLQDPVNTSRCVIIDAEGTISVFDSPRTLETMKSYESLIKPTIDARWDNFDAFLANQSQAILAYHANYFGAEPPKGQLHEVTALLTWHKMIANAKNVVIPSVPISDTGRKSTILNCQYLPGEESGTGALKTPQALACIRLFRACLGDQLSVSEGVLKKYVEDHAAELHTRQDPWRIFQYYRAQLISAKILRRVMGDQ